MTPLNDQEIAAKLLDQVNNLSTNLKTTHVADAIRDVLYSQRPDDDETQEITNETLNQIDHNLREVMQTAATARSYLADLRKPSRPLKQRSSNPPERIRHGRLEIGESSHDDFGMTYGGTE